MGKYETFITHVTKTKFELKKSYFLFVLGISRLGITLSWFDFFV